MAGPAPCKAMVMSTGSLQAHIVHAAVLAERLCEGSMLACKPSVQVLLAHKRRIFVKLKANPWFV